MRLETDVGATDAPSLNYGSHAQPAAECEKWVDIRDSRGVVVPVRLVQPAKFRTT